MRQARVSMRSPAGVFPTEYALSKLWNAWIFRQKLFRMYLKHWLLSIRAKKWPLGFVAQRSLVTRFARVDLGGCAYPEMFDDGRSVLRVRSETVPSNGATPGHSAHSTYCPDLKIIHVDDECLAAPIAPYFIGRKMDSGAQSPRLRLKWLHSG
jgi:hypothetical protein